MPLAQKPLRDTAAISGKFQVTEAGSSGAPTGELIWRKSPLLLSANNGTFLTRPNCNETSAINTTKNVKAENTICGCAEFHKGDCEGSLAVYL